MTNLLRLAALSLLACVIPSPAFSQEQAPPPAMDPIVPRINALVEARMAENNIPGYALTVIKNGNVILHRGYGVANLATGQPVANDTVFGLASITKTFTAITLLSLVDKGMVNLDDPLGKYLPGLSRQYAQLTIRQLASMTGGVPKIVNPEVPWIEQIPILDRYQLMFEPGSQFLYSNFSFRLLGSVIERVTGRQFFDVVADTILRPTQMNSTATTELLWRTGRVAQAYADDDGQVPVHPVQYKRPEVSFSAGMLATTNDDFTRYAFALLGRQFLSPAGYRTLWYDRPPLTTGAPSNWAFGFSSTSNPNFGGQRVVSMNGGTAGVASFIMLFPEQNSGVVALSNLRKPASYQIGKSVARLVFGTPGANAEEPPEPQPQD